jgi:hypothetical protein
MKKIDMSDKAISRRIKQTDQLREVSLSLMKAKKITAEEAKALRKNHSERREEEQGVCSK